MASSPTSEVQKFFAFPPGTNSATAADDIEAYGENVAIINEWQRRHFQPRIDKLKPFGDGAWIIDRYFAREVLCLSRDWYLFDCVVCEEDLPPSLKEAFEERGRSLLGQLGDYWKRYSRGMERWRTRLTDYLAVDDETEQKLRMWCVVEKLDAYQLMKILTDEGDTALWRAFRMGLNQCVQGRWVSAYVPACLCHSPCSRFSPQNISERCNIGNTVFSPCPGVCGPICSTLGTSGIQ